MHWKIIHIGKHNHSNGGSPEFDGNEVAMTFALAELGFRTGRRTADGVLDRFSKYRNCELDGQAPF